MSKLKRIKKTGRYALLQQFIADDMQYMFGNPGTVEEGMLDAMTEKSGIEYILTLQETVAIMAADGYARAARKPALVQIHSTPGLGNAIGALYQANRGHAPLVVIGGDAGIKYLAMDSQMAGDLVAFAEPVTKWSVMITDPSSLLRIVRRAIKIAFTPPMGPVYVCIPMDVLDAPCEEEIFPSCIPSTRVVPQQSFIQEAARLLISAQTPMIFMGDGVAWSDAECELTEVAELLGAEVWGCDSGELNMRYDHTLYQGKTGHMFGSKSLPVFSKGDVNLICGTYVTPEVFPELGNVFAPNAKTIHIDLNAYEIAKNHPVTLGVVSDPKLTLHLLARALQQNMSITQKKAASARLDHHAKIKRAQMKNEIKQDQSLRDVIPMHFSQFMAELVSHLPKDVVVFDETLTNSSILTRYLPPTQARHFFQTRGGSLGVGIAGAIGLKLANPHKTVVAFAGDGGSMYTIQALWSAARYGLDIKFIICNNRSYRILQDNIKAYWQERKIAEHAFPLCFDLSNPDLRFHEMAKGMGVSALRVEKPSEITSAIKKMLIFKGPFLIDLVIM